MQRLTVSTVFLLLLTTLAGCSEPGMDGEDGRRCQEAFGEIRCEDILTGDCADGYYVGCDENPDAHHILNEYGVHQFTNTSTRMGSVSSLDSGIAAWFQGGHGYPGINFGLDLKTETQRTVRYEADNRSADIIHPGGGSIFLPVRVVENPGAEHIYDVLGNTELWVWDVKQDSHIRTHPERESKYGTSGGGFDGKWMLLREFRHDDSQEDGWTAINSKTGESEVLFPVAPKQAVAYGTPVMTQTISGGSVFFSLRTENDAKQTDYTSIKEVVLDSMEWREIANVSGQTISYLDSSPGYVTYVLGTEQGGVVQLYDRERERWSSLDRPCESVTSVEPKVGGEWVIIGETCKNQDETSQGLVSVHIPTGEAFTLLQPSNDFGIVSWDTDGEYFIVELNPKTGRSSNMQYDQPQLYWGELPVAG